MKKLTTTVFILTLMAQFVIAQTFTLTSENLKGQATKVEEFNSFGCNGKNASPDLKWSNAPEGTKSFAITMYDPDAPTGSGWWHWQVFDIPANEMYLAQGAGEIEGARLPKGAKQGMNDYGFSGYGGPCPPEGHGLHGYVITVYALSTDKLGIENGTNAPVVGFYLNSNVLAKASIVAYYER